MKRFFLILLVALIAATPALAENTWYGTMMVDNCEEWVSLRDGPGTGCARLAKVPLYALVTEAEQGPFTGNFIYCNYDGQYGYILAEYLVPWADPEPEADGRFTSELGFSFDYDASVFYVDTGSEFGMSLVLYAVDDDVNASLEILKPELFDMTPGEWLESNAPKDAALETSAAESGATVTRFTAPTRFDRDLLYVYYAIEAGEGGAGAVGICPAADAEAWIAQFNAVVNSIEFDAVLPLRVDWAEATPRAVVVDGDGEYVTIMADEPVTGAVLLALELTDGGEEGFAFETEVLCEKGAMGPDDPFVVKIAFPGDMPSYGIRITDAAGLTRQFAISISGRDGSLVLSEF